MKNAIFEAFANPVRMQLLCCLSEERKTVSELIENCGLSQSAVSQHLHKLRTNGLVETKKEGKFIYYIIKYPESAKLAKALKEFIDKVEQV